MNESILKTECPTLAELKTFATGQLNEEQAEVVTAHIEECPACQEGIDTLTPQPDSLINALRGAAKISSDETPQLDDLMQAAIAGETLATENDRTRQPATSDTVNLEDFIAGVHLSGLLNEAEVDDWLSELAPADARTFAKALVKRHRLTRFQAQALLQGRHQHLVLGNYELLEPLGEGGMGRVFKARHRQLRRIVCLKVLQAVNRRTPQLVERFRREAKTVAALAHPNIIVAHDADDADGVPYLAMEFIEGKDLARHVELHGRFSPVDAVQIVLQAARALEYAHGQGVVHRDVKPSNLLLASEAKDSSGAVPLVKVLDLGLARFDSLLSDNPDGLTHTSMTSTGVVMGTVDYMSPEQAMNSCKADQRSDIYSLGCTLYHLLTGRAMYSGETVMEKLVAHREQPIPSLIDAGAEVPASLDLIFQTMVKKDPGERYQTMGEVVEDLERFLRGETPHVVPQAYSPVVVEQPPIPDSRAARRRQAIAMSIGTVAVLLVMAAGGWLVANIDWQNALEPVMLSSEAEPALNHVAAVEPFANHDKGRVLLVVPHGWFYEDHYQQVSTALAKRGISFQVASSTSKDARPKHGAIPPLGVDLTIDNVNVDDFDAVLFLGGNIHEFTHKSPSGGQQATAIISNCLDSGRTVAAIGNGWDVVRDSGRSKECQMVHEGAVYVGKPKDGNAASFLRIQESKDAGQLIDQTLAAIQPSSR